MQTDETQVRFQLRWLLLLISVVVLVLLRDDRLALALYVGAVVLSVAAWVLMVPRRVAEAERRFHREALRCLANDDYPGLATLADRQWLLKRFGRKHVLPDTLGLAAAASGDHAVARRLYLEALGHAPPDERARIELNLAGEEMALGLLDAAEGRYRSVLARRPDQSIALANLGRILLQKGEELTEAAGLLRRAAPLADPREADELRALADEAEARAGRKRP